MDIKLCGRDGCYEPAVGVGQRRTARGESPGQRGQDECRTHYLETVADDLVEAEVIGPVRITDARTSESVGKGGKVWLDPVTTAVDQLVYNRFIKVVTKEPAKKTAAKG